MSDLAYAPNPDPGSKRDHAPELSPARALLTPTWIAALAVLVTNDHVLKGADILPGVMTGKLSDFAGMIVAPVLLAALLRVRTRGALLACHVAVGAVFAAIQVSPAFASQWSALMGTIGYPWTITCDPTDLIALPFLGLAWALLVPEMDSSRPALAPLQRSAVAGLAVLGLWSTVATSRNDFDPSDQWYEDVFGNVSINNANDHDISLFVRPLRADLEIDCLQVSLDPGRLLQPEAFGDAEHWLLPARTNIGIELEQGQTCSAVWVAGEGVDPTIVFVDNLQSYPAQWWNGQDLDAGGLGKGGMALTFKPGGAEWTGGEQLRHVPRTDAPELPESCEAPAAESRLDWAPVDQGVTLEVVSVEAGADGCFELQLQRMLTPGQFDDAYAWYLCAPASVVPYTPGELIEFTSKAGNDGDQELEVLLLEPETFGPARDDQGRILRRVRYLRGGTDPVHISPAIGRDIVAIPGVSCPWQVEDGCATVERPIDLAVGDSYLTAGEATSFGDGSFVHTTVLAYSRERAIVDQTCSSGALTLSYDIDLAVIDEPL